ncbi:MAG: Fur family transcriptional regulator [Anaerolineae bacterium]|nr:transcriptional repressor [Caldilineales bacterium]MCX7851545.1 transcriptional repressor [Caldilineales bacterium]MDW8267684.1 Fur family transcriptional regulator [Anaerolineae bacterium]
MNFEVYHNLVEALHKAGYRLTPQRLAICRYLASGREHPTPAAVYARVREQVPTISLATVYNTLALLRQLGLITEMGADASGVRYETDTHPHANLICLQCGRVVDAPLPDLAHVQAVLAAQNAFELRSLRLDAYGLCPDCRRTSMPLATETMSYA